jgi:PBP4 family serine-type D-alanyl-D-alanine carboxypeptidase
MLKESDDYVAETLLKELGARVGGAGTTAAGAAVVRETLAAAGIDPGTTTIVDGSGLSRDDRVDARTLVALLARLRLDAGVGAEILADLPVAGRDGTLRNRLVGTPLAGEVRAKTGTTDESSGLAGLLADRYVFAVVENGGFVPAWTAHLAQDRFLAVLGSTLAAPAPLARDSAHG